jgi:hypothetical protein
MGKNPVSVSADPNPAIIEHGHLYVTRAAKQCILDQRRGEERRGRSTSAKISGRIPANTLDNRFA